VFPEKGGTAFVEAVEAFPVERVAGVREQVEFRIGDGCGEFL
jgi:hypothetical protein